MRRMPVAVVLLWLTGACHARRPEAPAPATVRYGEVRCEGCTIEEAVHREAEPSAVDCGWGRTYDEWDAVVACVLKADAEGRPFRAIMRRQGVDSTIITGYVRKADGTRVELWFDSDDTGSGRPCNASVSRRPCGRLIRDPEETKASLLKCDSPGERVPVCQEDVTRKVELGPVQDASDLVCDPEDLGTGAAWCRRREGQGNVPPGLSLVCVPRKPGDEYLNCRMSSGESNPSPGLKPESKHESETK